VVSNLLSIRFRDSAGSKSRSRKPASTQGVGDYLLGPENILLQTVADELLAPEPAYNPIFVFGPAGVGKSHFLRGLVGTYVADHPHARTLLTDGTDFARSVEAAFDLDSTDEMREAHRSTELFALDDLQELASKPHAQEELLHTIDMLLQCDVRILLASRVAPGDLPFMAGLSSRIHWGLTVPMLPLNPETAVLVVQRLAADMDLDLTPAAAAALSDRWGKKQPRLVPEFRGLLMQLRHQSTVSGGRLEASQIAGLLDAVHPPSTHSPRDIIKRTARHFGLKFDDLTGSSRRQTTVLARGTAVYLIRQLTSASFQQIGHLLGNRDHTTVLHAYRRIEAQQTEPVVSAALAELSRQLGAACDPYSPTTKHNAKTSKFKKEV